MNLLADPVISIYLSLAIGFRSPSIRISCDKPDINMVKILKFISNHIYYTEQAKRQWPTPVVNSTILQYNSSAFATKFEEITLV